MHSFPHTPKIKVAVSSLVRSQLELDVEDYGLRGIGDLCNRILAGYQEFPLPVAIKSDELFKNAAPIQFLLHRRNARFQNFADAQALRLAPLCRYYFEQYADLPRCRREIFVKSVEVQALILAMKSRATVTLNYRGKTRLCSPCFLAFSKAQMRAYVVVYEPDCSKQKLRSFQTLRIAAIDAVAPGTVDSAFHLQDWEISHQAEIFHEHFDPYLCYGEQVKVRFTPEGKKKLNRIVTNRPEVVEKNNDVYTFTCSELLAQRYFGQFFNEAEILEPTSLRLWFYEKFNAARLQYDHSNKRDNT